MNKINVFKNTMKTGVRPDLVTVKFKDKKYWKVILLGLGMHSVLSTSRLATTNCPLDLKYLA